MQVASTCVFLVLLLGAWVDHLQAQSESCGDSFEKVRGVTDGEASNCPLLGIGSYDSVDACKKEACDVVGAANVVNWDPTSRQCDFMSCPLPDVQFQPVAGGRDVYALTGPCEDNFIKIHKTTDGVTTECPQLGGGTMPDLEVCRRVACQRGANIFNWIPSLKSCYYSSCPNIADPQLTNEHGGSDIYSIEVPCTDKFIKIHKVGDGVTSRCPERGRIDTGHTDLDECIRATCDAGGNVLNWNPVMFTCSFHLCDEVTNLHLSAMTEGYEVHAVKAACNKKYKKLFRRRDGFSSGCQLLDGPTNFPTLKACMMAACLAGANTFNWDPDTPTCNYRNCMHIYDRHLTTASGGSDIYVLEELPRKPDFSFDYSAPKCSAGGHSDQQPNPSTVVTENLFILLGYNFECEGKISDWEFHAERSGSFFACVYRPLRSDNKLRPIDCNELRAETAGTHHMLIPLNYRIHVEAGDVIALAWRKQTNPNQVLSMTDQGPNDDDVSLSPVYEVSGLTYPYRDNITIDWLSHNPAVYSGPTLSVAIRAGVSGLVDNMRLNDDSKDPRRGRIEVKKGSSWGTICDLWTHLKGWPNLCCRYLGYPSSEFMDYVIDIPQFSPWDVVPNIHMKSPRCKATDHISMFSCWIHPKGECGHDKDIYIRCRQRVKLVGGTTNDRCEGVATIWDHGSWGTICDAPNPPSWHMANPTESWTSAFCAELGCSTTKKVAYAQNEIDDYSPYYSHNYPSPQCDVDDPKRMFACPMDASKHCSNDKDIYLDCRP